MIRRVVLLVILCLPASAHELALDVEMERPAVSLRASYGPGEPIVSAAVAASPAAVLSGPPLSGQTDESGTFTFEPPVEGEWLVRVDDGFGHVATRTVVVDWADPVTAPATQSGLWFRTGAGLAVIFGLTAFVVWGRRRIPHQQS